MNKFIFTFVAVCSVSQLSFASAPAKEDSRPTTPVNTAQLMLIQPAKKSPLQVSIADQETPERKAAGKKKFELNSTFKARKLNFDSNKK